MQRSDDLALPFQRFLQDNKLSSHLWAVGQSN
jgi:hypothetical protein